MDKVTMARQAERAFQNQRYLARHMPVVQAGCRGPEGAILPDAAKDADRIAVVYDKGDLPPEITITNIAGTVQTVHANGVAVAVVACAEGPRLTAENVVLVERFVRGDR